MKKCYKCGKRKPRAQFHKDRTAPDGYRYDCKECVRAYTLRPETKAKVAARHERVILSQRDWRARNPDKVKADNQARYQGLKERGIISQSVLRWQRNNPDKVRVRKAKRRARLEGNGGSFTAAEWQALCEQFNHCCACCGERKKLEADHVIPVVLGGTSYIDNIQPLCRSCNARKKDQHIDYRQQLVN